MKKFLKRQEDGFTIIELALVCVIIGVLSAIAIPFFGSQREDAIEATLVSDVRNAAMEMEKQAIFSEDGYAPEVPATFFESDGNMVVIDSSGSSNYSYCIIGSNPDYEDMFLYYHSDNRVVTRDMKTCGFVPIEEMGPLPLSPIVEPAPVVTPMPTPTPTPSATTAPAEMPVPVTPSPSAAAPAPSSSPTKTPVPSPSPSPTKAPVVVVPVKPAPAPAPAAKTIAPAPAGYDNPKNKKYKICHNGKGLELPLPGIINGHSGHKEDIIPVIPGQFTGQNWTIQGAAIWKNNCIGMSTIDYMG